MKVFLVVGTLFPFDRLVKEVDRWAGINRNIQVVGQVGFGKYMTENMEAYTVQKAEDFNRVFDESDLIVAHAGMGVILKSLVANKPIVVLPRRLKFKEHTTDHQMDTAKAFDDLGYVHVAWDTGHLQKILEEPEKIQSKRKIGKYASESLINALRNFISEN